MVLIVFTSCKEARKQDSHHEFTNDLVHETSPYLLQHAHNPVEWKAWNDAILDTAKENNTLILISIGYSSCHWCHVMEEETFEDLEVAKLMNDNFINIKVDREERPDIDQVYQTAAQLTGQNGGWPLNAITLPNGKPLYLGTYHTKEQWQEVLTTIHKQYTENPEKAAEYADRLAAGIEETNLYTPSVEFERLTKENLTQGIEKWKQTWDLEFGGNTGQQKFPSPNSLGFLLDYAVLAEDSDALQHVKNTLDRMAHGGIYDHLGGGFFRYSTDPYWKVPHFEKMLYDESQLIGLYSRAYKIFKEPLYKSIVLETIKFLEREMKSATGGYYATLDADSEGEEGKFYVWTIQELERVLGEEVSLFRSYYNITEANVWENQTYILQKTNDERTFLNEQGLKVEEFVALQHDWNQKLMAARDQRVRPNVDDKIITSWNALLITGLIEAYQTFGDTEFLNRAIAIYDFLMANSYSNGKLVHSYKEGSKRNEGFLEDYAYLANATIHLYKATLDPQYLDVSNELMKQAEKLFRDSDSGMYRFNADEGLISNPIKTHDGDIPSPNSVMAHNHFQLGHINYDPDYMRQSKTMLTTLLPYVTDYTHSYANWSQLLLHVSYPYFEIAVVGNDARSISTELGRMHLPNTLLVGSTTDSVLPLFEDRYDDDTTYIYVCQDRVCKLPVTTVADALHQLENF